MARSTNHIKKLANNWVQETHSALLHAPLTQSVRVLNKMNNLLNKETDNKNLFRRRIITLILMALFVAGFVLSRNNVLIINGQIELLMYIIFFPLGLLGTFHMFYLKENPSTDFRFVLKYFLTLSVQNPLITFVALGAGIMLPAFINFELIGISMDLLNNNQFETKATITDVQDNPDAKDLYKCKVYLVNSSLSRPVEIYTYKKFGLPSIEVTDDLKPNDRVILIGRESIAGSIVDKIRKAP
jgi:hypothetical protein